jgi:twinfilin-like protein
MIYSSGSTSTFRATKALLVSSSPNITIAPRTVETSDPSELDESYLKVELNLENIGEVVRETEDKKPFARPKGPARRRIGGAVLNGT